MSLLFNPRTYDPSSFDEGTRRQLLALIEFFESKGLARNKDEYYSGEWYSDFLKLIADKKIFATFATLSMTSLAVLVVLQAERVNAATGRAPRNSRRVVIGLPLRQGFIS